MDSEQIRALIKQRGIIKASITRIQIYTNQLEEHADRGPLKIKFGRLHDLWNQHSEIQTKLEIHDESTDHSVHLAQVEDMYDNLCARITALIDPPVEMQAHTLSCQSVNAKHSTTRLPVIQIPSFAGDYVQWRNFKDTFECIIVDNNTLSGIQKFQYLLSALKGEAKQFIQNITISDANFKIAYDLICQRYDNKKLIASQHLQSLLNLPDAQKNTVTELRQLINQFSSNKHALIALDLPISSEELLLSQLLLDKLCATTRIEFETRHAHQQFTTSEQLCTFLEEKCQTLELVYLNKQQTTVNNSKHSTINRHGNLSHSYVSTTNACIICNEEHTIYKCVSFLAADLQQRYHLVQEHKLCDNCLRSNHTWEQCKSTTACFKCNKFHHTLLHREQETNRTKSTTRKSDSRDIQQAVQDSQHNDNATSNSFCSFQTKPQAQVLLSTVIIQVRDKCGVLQQCRGILDNGSQTNFISEECVQRLRLNKSRHVVPLQGFNNLTSEATHCVTAEIHSRVGAFKTTINCSVLPRITGHLPGRYIATEEWNLPQDIQLADPGFNQSQQVDILLGAQLFMQILKMERKTRPGQYPVLQNTELGWIVAGEYCTTIGSNTATNSQTLFLRNDANLEQQLQRFWEIEEIHGRVQSKEEIECEAHFSKNTTRNAAGKFVVKLPLKQSPVTLGESKQIAVARFNHLERRLNKDPALKQEYDSFLTEYENMGHMKKAESISNNAAHYYLPHHPVFKQSSTTTKTRVVFDASCKTTNGLSLNDILKVGPTIQQDLFSIILRFRTHQIAFIADINKMYRQVEMNPEHHDLQRIIWRKRPQDPLQEYQLTTVTYGTASAPYLATRCLQQLAIDASHTHPAAAEIIRRDFYVDDCISGTNDLQEAIQLQADLRELLDTGGFPLRKWATNNATLLEAIPQELRENKHALEIDTSDIVKTLGITWNPRADHFQVVINLSPMHDVTKRAILSTTAAMFDPLGLISPVIITCKVFLQRLWQERLQWDETLPIHLRQQWDEFYSKLSDINIIKIDRLVINDNGIAKDLQLHGFSDASERAYGACLYVRTVDAHGVITVNLLAAKSKVAPLKKITLPRLELCAAHLLSRLTRKIIQIVNINFNQIRLWTDSTVALAWIAGCPSKWKTFVANRVAEIQSNTAGIGWQHVSTGDNPADLVSRGTTPRHLINNSLWWHGPSWLRQDISTWPQVGPSNKEGDLPDQRTVVLLTYKKSKDDIITRFSTLNRLQRVIAYCLRFISKCRQPAKQSTKALTPIELHAALFTCIRMAQREDYGAEVHQLSASLPLPGRSNIITLHPFIDGETTLRVGGRLQQSDLQMEAKHQAILPPNHHLTRLIIASEHRRLLHAGPQLLIASLRQHYWIPRIRQVVKATIHKCIQCFKLKAETAQQLMGNLPAYRVRPARPFLNVGVDYAGPLLIKTGSRRSKTKTKGYVAVFICLATRAIHLELVSDLSTSAFIAALRRFMARRGISLNIYSDNGTNFVGANHELHDLYTKLKQETESNEINNYLASRGCQWHFIPPSSPHFGGLWEAAVKSFKHHLRRTAGTSSLTFEELTTLLTQIEACLNSRPLTPIYDDHSDYAYLTPSHFLIGEPLTSIPDPNLSDVVVHRLDAWQQIQQKTQQIWRRWSTEYLHNLQQRYKWADQVSNMTPGTLVLVKEDNLPPLQWRVAVVEETHPGSDGLVRVVTLRTTTGRYKRPINKLCPFPKEDDN